MEDIDMNYESFIKEVQRGVKELIEKNWMMAL